MFETIPFFFDNKDVEYLTQELYHKKTVHFKFKKKIINGNIHNVKKKTVIYNLFSNNEYLETIYDIINIRIKLYYPTQETVYCKNKPNYKTMIFFVPINHEDTDLANLDDEGDVSIYDITSDKFLAFPRINNFALIFPSNHVYNVKPLKNNWSYVIILTLSKKNNKG